MGLKVVLAILAQVFILMPAYAKEPPAWSLTYQKVIDSTPSSKFGIYLALNNLTGYLTNEMFQKLPDCYGRVSEDYRKAIKEFTENLKNTFSEIKKIYGDRFKKIVTGAEKNYNYIFKTMSEFPNKLEELIRGNDSRGVQSLIDGTIFGMNHYDFELDSLMHKLMQQDQGAREYDVKILKTKEEAEEKTKKIMKQLNDCLYSYIGLNIIRNKN